MGSCEAGTGLGTPRNSDPTRIVKGLLEVSSETESVSPIAVLQGGFPPVEGAIVSRVQGRDLGRTKLTAPNRSISSVG